MSTRSTPQPESKPANEWTNDGQDAAATTPFGSEGSAAAGRFMCHHQPGPPIERTDTPARVDLKQEAVLAVLIAQAECGGDICTECEQLVDDHAAVAWRAYAQARVEYYRQRREQRPRSVTAGLAGQDITLGGEAGPKGLADTREIVRRIVRERRPGLNERQAQRVAVVMTNAQRYKRRHRGKPLPGALRAALARVRAETGLPLDTAKL